MSIRRLSTYGFAQRFVALRYPRIAEILAYPIVKIILDRIDANPGAIFIILGSPQIFKTLIGQLYALKSMMLEPCPALWYGKNDDTAAQVAIEKFNPLYDACMPALTQPGKQPAPALLFADRNKRTTTRYALPTGDQFLFLSAGPPINRQGKSAQDLYLDEPWEFEPGWIKEIQRRRGDFARYREIHMMTGPTFGSYSHELWEQSSKEVWHMRCTNPECAQLIPPNIGDGTEPGGLRYESGPSVRDANGKRILSATRASVRLECPHCRTSFPNAAHSRTSLNAGGALVATNPNPEAHIHGIRCPALPLRDWADIAVEKITADRARKRGDLSLTEDLKRKTEAETWNPEVHLQEKRLRPQGAYKRGEQWADEALDPLGRPVRFCTVDVQLTRFVLVIRMWSKSGASRLRFCENVTTPSRIRDLCFEHGVIPERVYLDARHEPDYVRKIAAQNGWRVLMGEDDRDYYHKETQLRRIFSEPRFIEAFSGTNGAKGVACQFMFSKQSALTRLYMLRILPGNGLDPMWSAASDSPEWYWTEIDAHYRKKVKSDDDSEYWVWMGLKEDHAGDCEAMQIVAASMAGLIGAESLDSAAQEPPKG